MRRSVGVSTKDDNIKVNNQDDATDSKGDSSSVVSNANPSALNGKCLKSRLKARFRRPSKETREVIDMGKTKERSDKGSHTVGRL